MLCIYLFIFRPLFRRDGLCLPFNRAPKQEEARLLQARPEIVGSLGEGAPTPTALGET